MKNRKQIKAEKLAAFETIVSEYESALLRYAMRIIRNYDASQDIVQNTFIKLFKNWEDEMQPSSQMSSWLYRVTHNCAVDYIRKESKRHLVHIQHSENHDDFIPPNRGDGFRISETAEKAAEAMHTLSLREQQLVVLKVYEEKSYQEISEITGLTVSNVGYILHYAMKKMAVELKETKTI